MILLQYDKDLSQAIALSAAWQVLLAAFQHISHSKALIQSHGIPELTANHRNYHKWMHHHENTK